MRDMEDEARIKAYMAAKMKHIKMYNECMNLLGGLDVAKFAELVRADEREACEYVCHEVMQRYKTDTALNPDLSKIAAMSAELCALRIRKRGKK
jgi:hypothetical protein